MNNFSPQKGINLFQRHVRITADIVFKYFPSIILYDVLVFIPLAKITLPRFKTLNGKIRKPWIEVLALVIMSCVALIG